MRIQLRRICPGAQICDADTFASLRTVVDQNQAEFIFLDLMMPGQDWRQELPDIVRRSRPGRCVVLSAIEDAADIGEAMAMGIFGFIPKRSDPKIIANALRLVLDGGVYVPAEYMGVGGLRVSEPRRPAEDYFRRLTPRQLDVLRLICGGLSNKQIAHELALSEATVKQHINGALKLIGAHNRTEAAMAAQRLGLFREDSPS